MCCTLLRDGFASYGEGAKLRRVGREVSRGLYRQMSFIDMIFRGGIRSHPLFFFVIIYSPLMLRYCCYGHMKRGRNEIQIECKIAQKTLTR